MAVQLSGARELSWPRSGQDAAKPSREGGPVVPARNAACLGKGRDERNRERRVGCPSFVVMAAGARGQHGGLVRGCSRHWGRLWGIAF